MWNQAFLTFLAGNRPLIWKALQLDVLVALPFMLYFYVIFFSLMQINLKL